MQHDNRKIVFLIIGVSLLGLFLLIAPLVLFVRAILSGHFPGMHGAIRTQYGDSRVVISSRANAYSANRLSEDELQFFNRTSVDAYQKVGRHNHAWDAAAVRYLERCCRASAGMSDMPSLQEMVSEGKPLIEAGCTDPMVTYYYGLALFKNGNPEAARPYIEQAVEGFKQCPYPRARARFAPTRLAEIDRDLLRPSHSSLKQLDQITRIKLSSDYWKAKSLALQWLGESMRDGSYLSTEQNLFFDQISDQIGPVFLENEVLDTLTKTPGADPYILATFTGRNDIDIAWEMLSNGRGNQITPAGRKGFTDYLRRARKELSAAWMQHPQFPQAPTQLIMVARGGHAAPGESVYTWFNRAVAAQMDYEPAYKQLLFALRPRLGGSYDEMYRVGLACLQTDRYDTIVPGYYFRTVYMIAKDSGEMDYWKRPETYQRLQTMFAGYLHAAPKQRNYYNSWYAISAWFCGHYDDAQRMLDALGNNADPAPFLEFTNCTVEQARLMIKKNDPPLIWR